MKIHRLDWLDWLTVLLCIWFVLYPHPYGLLFTVILLLPIIGLILHGYSRPSLTSLVTITTTKDNGTDVQTADFIVLPAIILSLRMLLDFEIENFYTLLLDGTITFIILLITIKVLYRNIERESKHKALTYFVVLGNVAIYSLAAVYGINCVYDHSEPMIYKVPIVNKSVYSGKHTTYYLEVQSWRKLKDSEKITVAKSQYNEKRIGDTVNVVVEQGLLKIPWHFIE